MAELRAIAVVMALFASVASAQTSGGSGVVYGPDHSDFESSSPSYQFLTSNVHLPR
jgi:hypothetical protein